jgi:putative endonuclease
MQRTYAVYILANWRRVTYIGVTGSLARRLQEHSLGMGSVFVRKYRLRRLVYVETCARAGDAIAREKQLKGWLRRRKVALIELLNPDWKDLSGEWGWRDPLDSAGPHPVARSAAKDLRGPQSS